MSRRMTPIQAANELIDTLEDGGELADELREWLLRGFKLCRAGSVKTVDDGLGLTVGQGKAPEKFCNAWRKQERNRLILEAADSLTGLKRCQKAKVISASMLTGVPEVEDYQARITLLKLRRLCTDSQGGPGMGLTWKSVSDIMNRQRR